MEIIDKPEKKSLLRKITEAGFTAFMWGIWSYLLMPILNILLWLFGIRTLYIEIFAASTYLELLDLMEKAGWSVLTIFLILRCWGLYNYWKFGKLKRRVSAGSDTAELQLSDHFQLPVETIHVLQTQKEVLWPVSGNSQQDVADWVSGRPK